MTSITISKPGPGETEDSKHKINDQIPPSLTTSPTDNDHESSLSTFPSRSQSPPLLNSKPTVPQGRLSVWDCLSSDQKHGCINTRRTRDFGQKIGYLPNGCILERWNNEIYEEIMRIQSEERRWIFKGLKVQPVGSIELWMIAHPRDQSRPTIVAQCGDIRIAKRMLYVLKSIHRFVDLNLGFDLLPWQEDIRSLQKTIIGGSRLFVHATPISLPSHPKRATLGGLLLINDEFYGLTVAHTFYDHSQDVNEDYESTMPDDESNWDEDFNRFKIQSRAADEEQPTHQVPQARIGHAVFVHQPTHPPFGSSSELHTLSKSANFVGLVDAVLPKSDSALIKISDPKVFGLNGFTTPSGDFIVPSQISSCPPNGPVYITTNSRLVYSQSIGVRSGIFLSASQKMQEVWLVEASLVPGDSGSWVIDTNPKEAKLYGIVIASAKDTSITYIVPASEILSDIKAKFGKAGSRVNISLPTEDTVRTTLDKGLPVLDSGETMAKKPPVLSTSPGVVLLFPSSQANIEVTSSEAASNRSPEHVSESTSLAPSSQLSQLENTTIKPGQESGDMSIGALAATNVSSADSTEIQSAKPGPKIGDRTDHPSGQSYVSPQVSKSVAIVGAHDASFRLFSLKG